MKPDYSKLITKDFLEEYYIKQNKTTSQIEKEFKFKISTTEYYIKLHGLKKPRRKIIKNYYPFLTKEVLFNDLINDKMLISDIAKKYNVHRKTIRNKLKEFGITKACKKNQFNKELLYDLYYNQNKSIQNIATLYKVSRAYLTRIMIKLGLVIKQSKFTVKWDKCSTDIEIIGYKDIHGLIWRGIKQTAASRNLKFSIDIVYAWDLFLRQDRKCSYSGLELNFGMNGNDSKNRTASLDRIDSSQEYVEGNVQWVHKDINKLKMDLSESKFLNYIKLIYENKKL